MKSQQSPNLSKIPWREILAFAVFPVCVSLLLIIKVFLIPGCLAFDSNDDGGGTFPLLTLAHAIMKQGALPSINLFYNFGVPFWGDCHTFALAPHSMTYLFLKAPWAMTVNRFLAGCLTLVVLIRYYGKQVRLDIACLLAFLALLTPGFFWNMAHHQFQMAVFYAVSLFILEEKMVEQQFLSRATTVLFFVTAALLIMSCSMNIVTIVFAFVAGNLFFLPARRLDSAVLKVGGLIVAAFLLTFPEWLSFLNNVSQSIRMRDAQLLYGIEIGPARLAMAVLGGLRDFRHPHEAWSYLSLPLLLVILFGVRHSFVRGDRREGLRALFLGLLPLGVILLALGSRTVYAHLPFMKGTDITRFWWISSIFMFHPAGKYLEKLVRGELSRKELVLFSCSLFVCLSGIVIFGGWGGFPSLTWIPTLFFAGIFFTIAGVSIWGPGGGLTEKTQRKLVGILAIFLMLGLAATKLSVIQETLGLKEPSRCRVSHWFSEQREADYMLPSFLPFMEKGSRLTHESEIVWRMDSHAMVHGYFGAQTMTSLVYRPLRDYLKSMGLIQSEDNAYALGNYHFVRPWNSAALSDLGIRYIVQAGPMPDAEKQGWKLLAAASFLHLYENRHPTGIAYLASGDNRAPLSSDRIRYPKNKIEIILPELDRECDLVVTFIARKGWRAWIDGKPVLFRDSGDLFMKLRVRPGDREVVLDYRPFPLWKLLMGWGGCLIILLLVLGRSVPAKSVGEGIRKLVRPLIRISGVRFFAPAAAALLFSTALFELGAAVYCKTSLGPHQTPFEIAAAGGAQAVLPPRRKEDCTWYDLLYPNPYVEYVYHDYPPCGAWLNTRGGAIPINSSGMPSPYEIGPAKDPGYFTIFLTGGSVASDVGFYQRMSGASSYLEAELNRRFTSPNGKPFRIVDAAFGGWKYPNQYLFFSLYASRVDALVTLDGYNEFLLMGKSPPDWFYGRNSRSLLMPTVMYGLFNPEETLGKDVYLEKVRVEGLLELLEGNFFLRNSYGAALIFRSLMHAYQAKISRAIKVNRLASSMERFYGIPGPSDEEEIFKKNVSTYQDFLLMMDATSRLFHLKNAHFIQPVPALYKKLTPEEMVKATSGDLKDIAYGQSYEKMANALESLKDKGVPVFSLLSVFRGVEEPLYEDSVHCRWDGPGYRLLSDAMADALGRIWELSPREAAA